MSTGEDNTEGSEGIVEVVAPSDRADQRRGPVIAAPMIEPRQCSQVALDRVAHDEVLLALTRRSRRVVAEEDAAVAGVECPLDLDTLCI